MPIRVRHSRTWGDLPIVPLPVPPPLEGIVDLEEVGEYSTVGATVENAPNVFTSQSDFVPTANTSAGVSVPTPFIQIVNNTGGGGGVYTPTSTLQMLSLPGDQVVTIKNGVYNGGFFDVTTHPALAHPATAGPYGGFLILKAETQGGVTILPANSAVDTQSVFTLNGAQRIIFVGFKTDGVVVNQFGTDSIYWWYGDHRYRGIDHPLYPGGANYGYSPTTFILGNGPGGRGTDNRWYGCQFHDTEDDAIRMRQQTNPLWQGCTWTNIYHSQTNFNYHSDCIQFTGGVTGAQILDGLMATGGGTGFMCGIENTNPQSIDVEMRRVWVHGSGSYGSQFFIRELVSNASIVATRERVHTWNTGGSLGNPGYTATSNLGTNTTITVNNSLSTNDAQTGTDPATAWRNASGHQYPLWESFFSSLGVW
jgi:hypothetical protein